MTNRVRGKFLMKSSKTIRQHGAGKKTIKMTVNRNTKIRIKRG